MHERRLPTLLGKYLGQLDKAGADLCPLAQAPRSFVGLRSGWSPRPCPSGTCPGHSSKTRSVTVVWVPCHSQDRLITARANTWACYHIKVQTAYSVGFTKAPKAPSNLSRPIVLVLLFLSAREANMAAQNGIGKEVGWARGRGS